MKKWRFDFRIWHWIHAAVVLGLLGTVFLRKTFLSWKTNSELLSSKLTEMDISITSEQAKVLATSIRSPMWEWHILLGYALVVLLLWRIILFFTKSGSANYKNFKAKTLHKKLVTVGYIGIYGTLFIMALSGLSLTFHESLALSKELTHTIKEVHEWLFNLVLLFVVLHVTGVVIAETRDEAGIISDMIHGKNMA
ncbi:MAG TPA: cytochrome b/b6 domain-containing protein [Sulfurovum sp.]|jgi:cytochrome b561|nr:MAG: cytochrome B [Sulfurovum sp. 28-43-6]OYZ50137.1 MAG: cytochrome B [Sulfurovum sp. 24-42-9]OZA60045.1 MAG: cytochrome B [Sulfurovum sp. 39-42-12]HQR73094.1 cytochrome b/b6 domain-containing protein [Sulfurovum sp.]HQS72535.1 cytochrome b/b6 domain-containing protein [Sulfurovum sp.]